MNRPCTCHSSDRSSFEKITPLLWKPVSVKSFVNYSQKTKHEKASSDQKVAKGARTAE